jgi:DNA-directed RNA polymerase specialized sigma24 family protein
LDALSFRVSETIFTIIESLVLSKYCVTKKPRRLGRIHTYDKKIHTRMNNMKKKDGPDQDLKSLLKSQHRRVYSICRFFANNYKEHQRLFVDIIAAASQAIRSRRGEESKQVLLLRACINMVALHSITLEMEPAVDRSIRFKSPDYQKNMLQFRERMGDIPDYEKMRLFLQFEQLSPGEISDLTGPLPSRNVVPKEGVKKNFIPYLKEKLIWS